MKNIRQIKGNISLHVKADAYDDPTTGLKEMADRLLIRNKQELSGKDDDGVEWLVAKNILLFDDLPLVKQLLIFNVNEDNIEFSEIDSWIKTDIVEANKMVPDGFPNSDGKRWLNYSCQCRTIGDDCYLYIGHYPDGEKRDVGTDSKEWIKWANYWTDGEKGEIILDPSNVPYPEVDF
jgi:hypothetical protein